MTDQITRARREWCEPPISETVLTHYGTKIIATPKGSSCPPSVVAALLDVLREAQTDSIGSDGQPICFICGRDWEQAGLSWTPRHDTDCKLVAAEAAIARALEGK
jgi:hypothetical protein